MLTVDGLARPWNPPTTRVRVADPFPISSPFAIPTGEATERGESVWLECLGLVRSDDEETVRAGL